ncbi:EnvZ/OmpR regulon moderator [Superficieibacter electus]|uniref:Modulator protein MzrA n=1 Tax=Superficieibacter electus TaxID=2022662 RepID=A0A2P5GNV0_9ENTR|nr:EnvZ/OmpR regulon moderator MzrA [Superficieibacter electus]POP44158.1 EnvZ/OmpR regulon moderator [Superficieibacter electus]POP48219.1 EnvZ/OmpR regulon moderator [Superficieibacter electus]
MATRYRLLRRISWGFAALMLFTGLFYAGVTLQRHESTLAIRPLSQGVSVPDGFSVWHQLDANGIRFKSITPHDDTLLIKFDSSAQSAAAKEVLDRSLPHGYIIAQQDEDDPATLWLTRLRDTPRRLG